MTVLADRDIRAALQEGRIRIDPYDPACLQPSSVDLHLDGEFRVFRNNRYPYIDPREPQPDLTEMVGVADDEAFILHPGEFVLGQTLEWVELPDDVVARLEGKALALDTPVPTPTGWRTMGDLAPGDLVFDELGEPTRVIDATTPLLERPCREVMFSDGQRVVADGTHEWLIVDDQGGRAPARLAIRSTDEIARSIGIDGQARHRVPLAGPVQYPTRIDLPIEPYTLGAWMGEGAPSAAAIDGHDEAILERISGEAHPVRRRYAWAPYDVRGTGRARHAGRDRPVGNGSPARRLQDLGLREGMSVPPPYLEAGVAQRQALLQGLMDTGGRMDEVAGRWEFTTSHEELADGVMELAASLGLDPAGSVSRVLSGRVSDGPRHRVTFKLDGLLRGHAREPARERSLDDGVGRFRAIDAVREVPSVPVRCIQVASPRGLFLVSRSFIPTHNSSLGRLGLLIHSTAGYVDPGWKGNLTLELSNVANLPIALYFGMRIGQISFFAMSGPVERPYGSHGLGSKYQGQSSPTESASFRDFRDGRRTRKGGPRRPPP